MLVIYVRKCYNIFVLQSNSHCNFFEWVKEDESEFEGKESEIEANNGKIVEEDEVCLDRDKVILELTKRNEKLKKKLQTERRLGKFLQFLFLMSWAFTVLFVVMFLLKVNCN